MTSVEFAAPPASDARPKVISNVSIGGVPGLPISTVVICWRSVGGGAMISVGVGATAREKRSMAERNKRARRRILLGGGQTGHYTVDRAKRS